MLSNRGLILAPIVCVCTVLLICGCSITAAAPGYFPDVLSCGSWPDRLVPPSDVLAQTASAPPLPLLAESFQTLARSAIAPKWLPYRSDDAMYLEHGEGAYRAHTAHLCKVFQRSGCTVVLKGFAGRLVAIVEPLPVTITAEAREAMLEATKRPADPCRGISPYEKEGAPPAVVSMFASIRDELLASAAHPVSSENWNRQASGICVIRGGLQLSYLPRGPISDPGVAAEDSVPHGVTIWTDGKMLLVRVGGNDSMMRACKLYKELQPIVDLSREGMRLPYVSRMTTRREWTNPAGDLVPTREQATHQKLYFDLGNDLHGMGLVPNPAGPAEIEEAAWLCLARSSVSGIASNHYHRWGGGTSFEGSPSEVLQRLRDRQARHLAALNRLEQAPCPQALAGARSSLLSQFRVSKARWDVAWSQWQTALSNASAAPVDYEPLKTTVSKEIASQGLPVSWDWGQCWDIIRDAGNALGITTDDVHAID